MIRKIKLTLFIIITTLLPIFLDVFVYMDRIYTFLYTLLIIPAMCMIIAIPSWGVAIIVSCIVILVQSSLGYYVHSQDVSYLTSFLILDALVNLSVLMSFTYYRINNFKIMKRLENLTLIDSLTGAYNRRYFELYIQKAIPHLEKSKNPFVIIMADLDYFKKINDTYGHHCGDTILTSFVQIVKSHIRPLGEIIRYGGEEFVIILPKTTKEEGREIAELIGRVVQETEFTYKNQKITVTVSMGLALYHDESVEHFIQKADQALFKAKENGRNQVVVYSY